MKRYQTGAVFGQLFLPIRRPVGKPMGSEDRQFFDMEPCSDRWNEGGSMEENEKKDIEEEYKTTEPVRERMGVLKGFLGGIFVTLCVLGILLFLRGMGGNGGQTSPKQEKSLDATEEQAIIEKTEQIKSLIDVYYLDEVEEQNLVEGMYSGYVAGLKDPYSVYYTKEDFTKFTESTSGIYQGIGAMLSQNMQTGIITVVRAFEGTPAAEVGILPGDVLYKIEDTEVTGMDLTKVVSLIKTENKDSKTVRISVVREGEDEPLEFDVERREIEVPTVEYEMMENHIGYLQITEFEEVTSEQFRTAMEDLRSQGMEKLVIDLRDNPGGVLGSVCDILEQILPKGLIVYTEDKNGKREEYFATGEHELEIPLTVLVNGQSASAAEIFAGAVKDYGIGTLVGTTTFGKGIVQRIMELGDGTAIKLTIAKYYTPNGNYIHEVGIEPDVEIELSEDMKKKAVIEKSEDNQLQKAIEILQAQ